MVGIDDVAKLAGVSTATVSRALSGRGYVSTASQAKVVDAAAQLGYVVSSYASSLASGRTRNVGLVVPILDRWYFSSVVSGAQQALHHHGFDLTLYNLAGTGIERARVFDHFLLRQRVDAVIAVSLEPTDAEISRLYALEKPIVGIGGPIPRVPTLMIDDVAVAQLATEHLIGLGHLDIAHIGGSQEFDPDFHTPSNRHRGFRQAMTDAGMPTDPQLFRATDFSIAGGYQAGKLLLEASNARPTAIFAASDEMAIGAILAARELGLRVPHDLSVIGIDDHDLAEFFGLTTVAQFPNAQGRAAVELLMTLLDSPEPPTQLTASLPYSLVVRSTTAPLA